jgi:hypothetical protein
VDDYNSQIELLRKNCCLVFVNMRLSGGVMHNASQSEPINHFFFPLFAPAHYLLYSMHNIESCIANLQYESICNELLK